MQIDPTSPVNTASLSTGPLAGQSPTQRAVSDAEAESFATMATVSVGKTKTSSDAETVAEIISSGVINNIMIQEQENRQKLKEAIEEQA